MAEVTETPAEVVEEIAEDVAEVLAREFPAAWFFTGWLIGGCIGIGTGFLAARRYLEVKYQKVAEDEIDQMREHFRKRLVARDIKPELSELGKRAQDLGYTAPEGRDPLNTTQDPAPPGEVNTPSIPAAVQNVFKENPDPRPELRWDYEVEKAIREGKTKYVIHQDEYGEAINDGEDTHEELQLTYYEGDDVLCDSEDKVVEDQDAVVGLENMEKFGHGSGDSNIVYVRNETLHLDLEIIRTQKTFAEEVHGLKHEDWPSRRRRRPRDG